MKNKIFLDTCGLKCPDPLILVRKAVREASSQDIIEVVSDDIVSKRDIPAFCNFMGHSIEIDESDKEKIIYKITKK